MLTIGVMAVALALPLGLALALDNLRHFAGSVEQSREIDLFLKPEIDVARAQALATELRGRGDIARVELRTPEQGLAEFRARSGLGEAIGALEENPLPSLLSLPRRDDDAGLVSTLEGLPETGLLQHDAAWRPAPAGLAGFRRTPGLGAGGAVRPRAHCWS